MFPINFVELLIRYRKKLRKKQKITFKHRENRTYLIKPTVILLRDKTLKISLEGSQHNHP